MMTPPAKPVRYAPSVETVDPTEAETANSIIKNMRHISSKTFKDRGRALRPVHAKSHALLQGTFRVLDHLPQTYAQGLFAKGATYPLIMRISTIAGDIMDDSVSLPRGMAIKVLGVPGERLPGSETETSQDFLLVNGPNFGAPDAMALARSLALLAPTTDHAQGLKKAYSAVARGVQWALAHIGAESSTLASLGGQPETHPLGETYYTEVPVRYGEYIAKLSIVPFSPDLRALTDRPLSVNGKPNGLREGISAFFADQAAEWEVRVQLCTDLETMPIEDASVAWSEDASPYLAVGRIVVEPQPGWTKARSKAVDDGMSFRPWHGITAHQPLGGVMRVRRQVYAEMVEFRTELGGCPVREPDARVSLPS